MSVAGKVVVITGATRGIGRSIAEACVREGADVVVCARDGDAVDRCTAELRAAGPGSAFGCACDVSEWPQVEALRERALKEHGRIDVWFNNAGISLGYEPLDEEPPGELARIVAINLTGHILGCRAALPYFREHGGYLMNMCGRGYRGEATPHTAAYAATKAAIASLTKSLAAENRDVPRLSINGFVPGMVDTDFYRDLRVSPRLENVKDNWRFALDAFGVELEEVGRRGAEILGEEPGRTTGHIYSLLTPMRTARGIGKMTWWSATGKMKRA